MKPRMPQASWPPAGATVSVLSFTVRAKAVGIAQAPISGGGGNDK